MVNITVTTLNNFFTASYTGARNNYTGTLGFQFTPTQNLTVTALRAFRFRQHEQ